MYYIERVTNKKQLKEFVNFLPKLYKGCEYFVAPFASDEMKHLDPKRSAYMIDGSAEAQCFLCRNEKGEIVGRVCGILSHAYNRKYNDKRVRISRFDCIDDDQVAKMLFDAVENWGREKGMTVIHGPMGFNDLEHEGLLVDGFNTISTANTQYYYPYYQHFFDDNGYQKEVDWLEYRFWLTNNSDERTSRLSDVVSERLGIHELEVKSIPWLIKNYYNEIFDVLDEAFEPLYGTVPITKAVRESVLSQFKTVLRKDLISVLVDKDNHVVAAGIMMPGIAKSLKKCNSKLFPFGWIGVLRELNHPEVIEMLLIGVKKEYAGRGVTSIIFHRALDRIKKHYSYMEYAETNIQLEDNYKVQSLFNKAFETKLTRRRRCYYKSLDGKPVRIHKAFEEQEPVNASTTEEDTTNESDKPVNSTQNDK